ncbi:hypothetical protein FRX31_010256, partial [Thalictrum thalictroides]
MNSLDELYSKLEKYRRLEDIAARQLPKLAVVNMVKDKGKKVDDGIKQRSPKKESGGVKRNQDGSKGSDSRSKYDRRSPPRRFSPKRPPPPLPPLTLSLEQIYKKIKNRHFFREPSFRCRTLR